MARLKFVVHERQLAYQKALEILAKEDEDKKLGKEIGKSVGKLTIKTMPRIVRERIRKFRHHSWREQADIQPVPVNQTRSQKNA
jgi:hypothetical protein